MAMRKFTVPENLNDWNKFPGMARWFSPRLLVKIAQKVVASTLFGQYADKRAMHASLDMVNDEIFCSRFGDKVGICGLVKGPLFLDYVADLGDGFDSTYAIAYLIGQREIPVGELKLPRANCLIMGGDQVYPDASREDYHNRLQQPYESAFPRTEAVGSEHPPIFIIPGNHDWYDGLTLFLAKFCRGRDTFLGSWVARQSRSYFAIHLKDNWWVWGFDSQLGEDIDAPQASYFVQIAKQMTAGSKVILCASIPSWLDADAHNNTKDERSKFGRGADYIAGILRDECLDSKIPLVLSGDLHHYSRFIAEPSGTNFITAGGGGAFLHPTHGLATAITLTWVDKLEKLKIALLKAKKIKKVDAIVMPAGEHHPEVNGSAGTHPPVQKGTKVEQVDVCYPSRKVSRSLSLGNIYFLPKNLEFSFTLGGLYWFAALLMLAWNGYGKTGGTGSLWDRYWNQLVDATTTPVFVLIIVTFFLVLRHYADVKKNLKSLVGGIHALIHLVILVAATVVVSVFAAQLQSWYLGDICYFIGLGLGMVIAGALGGIVWGLYLLIASYFLNGHPNDAFSAMRLDSFRHFLRMKIDGDSLTIFPVGIDKSPSRTDWQKNSAYQEGNQNTPFIVPRHDLGQRLIEDPIIFDVSLIKPLKY